MILDEASEANDSCPLCGDEKWIEVRRVAAGPIREYWRIIGIDLKQDYPAFPNSISQRQCLNCGLHVFSPMIVGRPSLYAALLAHNPDWYYASHKWEFVQVLEHLSVNPAGRLLEIGCGVGNFLTPAAQICDRAIGIEFNPEASNQCREKGLDVRDCSIADLDEVFDVIVSFQVLEHVGNPGEVLLACLDRLAPNGRLIVAVPNQDGVLGELNSNFLNLPPHHVTLWKKRCFEYIARRHNLFIEAYLVEPIAFELYATRSYDLLNRLKHKTGFLAKMYNLVLLLLHRAQLPLQFENNRRSWPGHTHIAIFRKDSK